jgi:hypothetical protein
MMAINNMNDGVGKKIVEALKMQSEGYSNGDVFVNEEENLDDTQITIDDVDSSEIIEEQDAQPDFAASEKVTPAYNQKESIPDITPVSTRFQPQQAQPQVKSQTFVDDAFNQSLARNLGTDTLSAYNEEFDYPPNVAVLKQLIAKLPSGVSKQTGAIIIKQTMEALGISMGSVLQEAKQFQDNLTNNSIECKNNILEYRKQITVLEAKAQQYQRQSALMNDIISLFIQTK